MLSKAPVAIKSARRNPYHPKGKVLKAGAGSELQICLLDQEHTWKASLRSGEILSNLHQALMLVKTFDPDILHRFRSCQLGPM